MHRFGVWGTFRYGVAFLAWQSSYFDLAKSFPARLINRYLRRWGVAVTSTWSGILLGIGARDRPQDALGEGPAVRGGASGAAEEAAQPLI